MQVLIIFFLVLNCYYLIKLPNNFKKCSRSDNNIEKCLIEAVTDAVKQLKRPMRELGLFGLNPLVIPSMVIDPGKQAIDFKQYYKNITSWGFTNISITKFEFDFEAHRVVFECNFPGLEADARYSYNGKIMFFPLRGEGNLKLFIDHPKFFFVFQLNKHEKKGKTYYRVVNTTLKIEPQFLKVKMDNFNGGDENLSERMEQVFNENWRLFYEDAGSNYEEAFAKVFGKMFDNILKKVSILELFDE